MGWVFCLNTYLYLMCLIPAEFREGYRKDILELELVVSRYLGAADQIKLRSSKKKAATALTC